MIVVPSTSWRALI
uniref:Uncharacterized protein n=1 Tax=Vitis vinifera TaxID=29760 RepID=F6HMV9_VITVI